MSPQVRKVLTWTGYPAFYVVALIAFAYLTFPYDRLRERIVGSFEGTQRLAEKPYRLQIDDLSSYFLSGLEAHGVKLAQSQVGEGPDGKPLPPKEISIDDVHARVSLLSLLTGSMTVTFGASAFGGELAGEVDDGSAERSIELRIDAMDIGAMPFFSDLVGLPLGGSLVGKIQITAPESKLEKANGHIELTITGLWVGDGKAKVRDTLAFPRLEAGTLTFLADITDGQLEVQTLAAKGPDLELVAEGSVRLRDPVETSLAELSARFKFADAYKTKSDLTKSIFGEPGSSVPGLFDMDSKVRRAKRDDGFYGWRVTGPLSHLTFHPSALAADAPKVGKTTSSRRKRLGFARSRRDDEPEVPAPPPPIAPVGAPPTRDNPTPSPPVPAPLPPPLPPPLPAAPVVAPETPSPDINPPTRTPPPTAQEEEETDEEETDESDEAETNEQPQPGAPAQPAPPAPEGPAQN